MRITFTKLSDEQHRFGVARGDGSHESIELATRSYLLHDWVHYAVEAEAGIQDGFYGLLAGGTPLARLNDRSRTALESRGLGLAESLVGPLQSVYRGRLAPLLFLEQCERRFPGVADAAFLDRVGERLRGLSGHWRATAYGTDLQLTWPSSPLAERAAM